MLAADYSACATHLQRMCLLQAVRNTNVDPTFQQRLLDFQQNLLAGHLVCRHLVLISLVNNSECGCMFCSYGMPSSGETLGNTMSAVDKC